LPAFISQIYEERTVFNFTLNPGCHPCAHWLKCEKNDLTVPLFKPHCAMCSNEGLRSGGGEKRQKGLAMDGPTLFGMAQQDGQL
jgi:hypothetical protein